MSNQKEEKSLDVSAKTIEEAIESGLTQLNVTRDQVDIEIISEGKRGIFGLVGSEEATVRLTIREAQSPQQPPAETTAPAPTPAEAPAKEPPEAAEETPETVEAEETPETAEETAGDEAPAAGEEKPEAAEAKAADKADQDSTVQRLAVGFLQDLLELMGVEGTVSTRIGTDLVEPDEKPPLVLDISGRDLGILIGRRSETLRALQFMVRLMVNKQMGSWQRVVVDVESYRARRRRSLQQMAHRMAARAVANQERVILEAMSAYDRRIVHIALRDNPKVITKSVGRDSNRKVTIIPK